MSDAAEQGAAPKGEIGTPTVHWVPLNDTKQADLAEEPTTARTIPQVDVVPLPSPHRREMSTMDYQIDQDAYDAARDWQQRAPRHAARPSPHKREMSTMDFNDIDQDAYDAARESKPSFFRSASQDTYKSVDAILETTMTTTTAAATTSSSTTTLPLPSSGHGKPPKAAKKSKDAPLIPAAQLSGEADTGDRIRLGICAMEYVRLQRCDQSPTATCFTLTHWLLLLLLLLLLRFTAKRPVPNPWRKF